MDFGSVRQENQRETRLSSVVVVVQDIRWDALRKDSAVRWPGNNTNKDYEEEEKHKEDRVNDPFPIQGFQTKNWFIAILLR